MRLTHGHVKTISTLRLIAFEEQSNVSSKMKERRLELFGHVGRYGYGG